MDEPTEQSLPRVAATPMIGHVLDSRYEIFEQVGSGEVARVFRAWDRRVQRIVAVKILDRQVADDPEIIRSFAREARLVAGLPHHRNIVTVHYVGHDGIVPYVVMQFVAGGNLKQLMAGEAPLDAGRAFAICQQVARGLEFAHQYGIVHGNLKPENVLISNGDEVKLTDFGVIHSGRAGGVGATNGRALHSPYLSPEQELGKAPSPQSDIYSLGVILYEMVAGCLPFGEAGSPSLKHSLDRAPDPSQINPDLPPAAAPIVVQALERDPDHRYESAAAFAAALHRYLVLDRGDTLPTPGPEGLPHSTQSGARPVEKPQKQEGRRSRTEQRDMLGFRPPQRHRPPLMSLLYLITVAIAVAGGWFTYGALSRAINGSSSGSSQSAHPTPRPTSRVGAQRQGQGRSRRAVIPARRANIAGGCPVHSVGPVRLVRIWAEATAVHPGGTTTFEYTVANDAAQCRDVLLGLTAFSDARPGVTLGAARTKVIGAMPGTHLYKRQFTFPPSVAGQRFDILWSVADPSGAHVYGSSRVNGLITVSPS